VDLEVCEEFMIPDLMSVRSSPRSGKERLIDRGRARHHRRRAGGRENAMEFRFQGTAKGLAGPTSWNNLLIRLDALEKPSTVKPANITVLTIAS
jgi:hypothetical protein